MRVVALCLMALSLVSCVPAEDGLIELPEFQAELFGETLPREGYALYNIVGPPDRHVFFGVSVHPAEDFGCEVPLLMLVVDGDGARQVSAEPHDEEGFCFYSVLSLSPGETAVLGISSTQPGFPYRLIIGAGS